MQEKDENGIPLSLKIIENSDYTFKLMIKKQNIDKEIRSYTATDIFKGFFDDSLSQEGTSTDQDVEQTPVTQTYSEVQQIWIAKNILKA